MTQLNSYDRRKIVNKHVEAVTASLHGTCCQQRGGVCEDEGGTADWHERHVPEVATQPDKEASEKQVDQQ